MKIFQYLYHIENIPVLLLWWKYTCSYIVKKYSCTCIMIKIFLYLYYDGNIPVLILWRKYSCSCIMIKIFLYLYYVYLAMHESPIISILLLGHAYFWPITVGALTIIHLRDSTQNIRKRFKIRIHFYQKHPPANSK